MTVYKHYRVPVDFLLENPSLHGHLKQFEKPERSAVRNNELDKNDSHVRQMVKDYLLKHGRSTPDQVFAGLREEGAALYVDDVKAKAAIRRTISRNSNVFVRYPDGSVDVRVKPLRMAKTNAS